MPLTCPRCTRANPPDAAYCFHDGAPLQAAGGHHLDPAARPFPSPFVFPSGIACRTFDELAVACANHWSDALDLLRQGFLGLFLGNIGRADLALAAREAAAFPDPDRGLDQLLDKLPSKTVPPPRLHVLPADVHLGPLRPGTNSFFHVQLSNEGRRLLHGSVSCDGCDWLSLGDAPGVHAKLFQFLHDSTLTVHVIGERLRAGAKPLEGTLQIQTSGGTATVTVRADVPVQAFPDGALAGAVAPRQIAEKAKARPREAAALFENGAVETWYKDNGWVYPVLGPAVSGLASVQQFFEALGLVKPPKVEISETQVTLSGKPGETLRYSLVVSSAEKRPIYARAITDASWLRVVGVRYDGRIATVQLAVPSAPDLPGETVRGKVTVTSNGNQQFEVSVVLTVAGTPRPVPELRLDEEPIAVPPPAVFPVATAAPLPVPPPAAVPIPSLAAATGKFAGPLRDTLKAPHGAATMAAPLSATQPTGAPRVVNYATAAVPPATASPPPIQSAAVAQPLAVLLESPAEKLPVARFEAPPPPPAWAAPAPSAAVPPSSRPSIPPTRGKRWAHATPLLLIALGLLGTFIHDLIELKNAPEKQSGGPVFEEENAGPVATIEVKFHNADVPITVGQGGFKPGGGGSEGVSGNWPPSMRFGVLIREPEKDYREIPEDKRKRLTFDSSGLTNNVCLKVDTRQEYILGERQSKLDNGELWPPGDWPGRWLEQDTPLGQGRTGRRSVWYLERERLEITQIVEVVKGPQTGSEDTCVVRYRIVNQDTRPHRVGIRFLLDTYVGENDGAPYLVPGAGRTALVSTKDQFEGTAVPDFIQALEKSDLTDPGTIAQLQLRVSGLEAPSKVTLGAYPNPRLRRFYPLCNQEKTLWDVPLLPIRELQNRKLDANDKPDSAVVLYWDERFLDENGVREVGFSYGLGQVAARQSKGQLALTVAGSFKPAEEFTATAYVKNPKPGQTVTLDLPAGFKLIEGKPTEPVPQPSDSARGISPVSWHIKAPSDEGDDYKLMVTLSSGPSQTAKVKIVRRNIFGN